MKRVLYLDFIRILSCVMIIAMHAPIPNTGMGSYVLSADSFLTAPGIGLFIMVSGALLLPVNMETMQFLKRRLKKIFFPTLFWTIFYMLVSSCNNELDRTDMFRSLLSIPFSNQFCGTLWFMYMLTGLYLLAPVLSPWLRQVGKKELKFYLFLWSVTMCYPLIRDYIHINESYTGILYYFGGYVGYFVWGYYLRTYVSEWKFWKCLLLLLIPIFIAIVTKVMQIDTNFYDMFWYLSIFVVMMSTAWFMLIKRINIWLEDTYRFHSYIIIISNCCFGIYLIHIFVMRSIIWKWSWMYDIGYLQILVVTLFTFIGSLFITWLLSFLPWAQYIIGFKRKK